MHHELPPLRLHDTRRGKVTEFIGAHTVRLYVCGITPYDSSHLGHAATYSAFDVLVRALEARGHEVRYCRNVTDVDDDLIRVSRERDVDMQELAERENERFEQQMDALGLRRPDHEPRATAVIDAIITATRGLERNGHAYALEDGRVYFDVGSVDWPFGTLVELTREQRLERFAEYAGDPDAPDKRDPLDFLLWQPREEFADGRPEPSWPSPWGEGRPGWHVECSVMAMEELGPTIDIHGGGSDLVYPHHEAEILQSEQLTGQAPFARFWLHTAMVGLEGEKMSKSKGNLVYVDNLLEDYAPAAVRRELLRHHYRADWSFDYDPMREGAEIAATWDKAVTEPGRDVDLEESFHAALADDLDTPTAVEIVDEAASRGAGETVATLAGQLGVPLGL